MTGVESVSSPNLCESVDDFDGLCVACWECRDEHRQDEALAGGGRGFREAAVLMGKSERYVIVGGAPLRYLAVVGGCVVGLGVFVWLYGFGPLSSYVPSFAGGRFLRLAALGLACAGMVVLLLWIEPSAIRNRFAVFVGDMTSVRRLAAIGAHGRVLNGDLSDAELLVEDLGKVQHGVPRAPASLHMVRFTIRSSGESITHDMVRWFVASGSEERFEAWKRAWMAHNASSRRQWSVVSGLLCRCSG